MIIDIKNITRTSICVMLLIVALKLLFQIISIESLLDWREYITVLTYSFLLTSANALLIIYLDKKFTWNEVPRKRIIFGIIYATLISLIMIGIARFIKVVLIYNRKSILEFVYQEQTKNYLFPLLITFVIVLFYYCYQFIEKNKKQTAELKFLQKNKGIFIQGRSKNDILKIPLQDLIYVKSEGNYFEVFYKMEEIMKSKLFRGTLRDIEKLHPSIYRANRSHLFNMNHFIEMKKKSNLFSIVLEKNIEIPISKKHAERLRLVLLSSQKQVPS